MAHLGVIILSRSIFVLLCYYCVAVHECLYWKLVNLSSFIFEALQQGHLLESMGHSRQPSDSSMDKFVSRDEAAESADQENKVSLLG